MTLDEILQSAHRIYDGNTDYPVSGDDDYLVRVGVVQDFVKAWENEPILWKELFELNKSLTINSGTADLPADFKRIVGYIEIDGTEYGYAHPQDRKKLEKDNETFYTIYGSTPKLYFYPNPDDGTTFNIDYYKKATIPASGSDVVEMSKPLYLVYMLVSKLYEQDNRNDKSVEYENKAIDVMTQMIEENETPPVNFSDTMDIYWQQ